MIAETLLSDGKCYNTSQIKELLHIAYLEGKRDNAVDSGDYESAFMMSEDIKLSICMENGNVAS